MNTASLSYVISFLKCVNSCAMFQQKFQSLGAKYLYQNAEACKHNICRLVPSWLVKIVNQFLLNSFTNTMYVLLNNVVSEIIHKCLNPYLLPSETQ